mgnify:CR=1 FL=1
MKRKTQKKSSVWVELLRRIESYKDAAVAESWKGGGDPADVEVLELNLKLTEAQVRQHLEVMRREYE